MSLQRQHEKNAGKHNQAWGVGVIHEKWFQILGFHLQQENVKIPGLSDEAVERIQDYMKHDFPLPMNSPCCCENDLVTGTKCGPRSKCINRDNSVECGPNCSVEGVKCLNNEMTCKVPEKKMSLEFRGSQIGFGMIAREFIHEGEFVAQYVGELFTYENNPYCAVSNYSARIVPKTSEYDRTVVDPYRSGNGTRYLQTSCRPNLEVLSIRVGDTLKLGVYALKNIQNREKLVWKYETQMRELGVIFCRCWEFEACPDIYKLIQSTPRVEDNNETRWPELYPEFLEEPRDQEHHADYVNRIIVGLKRRGFELRILSKEEKDAVRILNSLGKKQIHGEMLPKPEPEPEKIAHGEYFSSSSSSSLFSSFSDDEDKMYKKFIKASCNAPPTKMTSETRSRRSFFAAVLPDIPLPTTTTTIITKEEKEGEQQSVQGESSQIPSTDNQQASSTSPTQQKVPCEHRGYSFIKYTLTNIDGVAIPVLPTLQQIQDCPDLIGNVGPNEELPQSLRSSTFPLAGTTWHQYPSSDKMYYLQPSSKKTDPTLLGRELRVYSVPSSPIIKNTKESFPLEFKFNSAPPSPRSSRPIASVYDFGTRNHYVKEPLSSEIVVKPFSAGATTPQAVHNSRVPTTESVPLDCDCDLERAISQLQFDPPDINLLSYEQIENDLEELGVCMDIDDEEKIVRDPIPIQSNSATESPLRSPENVNPTLTATAITQKAIFQQQPSSSHISIAGESQQIPFNQSENAEQNEVENMNIGDDDHDVDEEEKIVQYPIPDEIASPYLFSPESSPMHTAQYESIVAKTVDDDAYYADDDDSDTDDGDEDATLLQPKKYKQQKLKKIDSLRKIEKDKTQKSQKSTEDYLPKNKNMEISLKQQCDQMPGPSTGHYYMKPPTSNRDDNEDSDGSSASSSSSSQDSSGKEENPLKSLRSRVPGAQTNEFEQKVEWNLVAVDAIIHREMARVSIKTEVMKHRVALKTEKPESSRIRGRRKNTPWKCSQCPRMYTETNEYESHLRHHFKYGNYICGKCKKGYHTYKALHEHMRRHVDTNIKFGCQKCGRQFAQRDALYVHMRRYKNHASEFYDKIAADGSVTEGRKGDVIPSLLLASVSAGGGGDKNTKKPAKGFPNVKPMDPPRKGKKRPKTPTPSQSSESE